MSEFHKNVEEISEDFEEHEKDLIRKLNKLLNTAKKFDLAQSFETANIFFENTERISKKEKIHNNNKFMDDLYNPDCDLPKNENHKNQIISKFNFYLLKLQDDSVNLICTIRFEDINGFIYKSNNIDSFYGFTYKIHDVPDIRKALLEIYENEDFKKFLRNSEPLKVINKEISSLYRNNYGEGIPIKSEN